MQKTSLFQLQRRFSKLVQSGQNNSEEVNAIGILHQSPLSIQQRFHIYQNAYHQRILECLEDDFPRVKEVLQEAEFSKLVQDYLKKYPSHYWSIGEVGKHLSQFISQSSWGNNYEYLADLACFEWLKVLASFALIADKFDFLTIANVEEDKQQEIILKFDSSVQFFKSCWSLHAENIVQENNFYVIYQKEGVALHNVFSEQQWDILLKISQGWTVGKIIESLPDIQEGDVTNLFSLLVAENIITHFTI